MNGKCFIVCRQSGGAEDPEDSLSISVQTEECKKVAKAHGIEVLDVFQEASTSGRLYPTGFEALAAQDIIYTAWCKETKKTGQWRRGLGEALKRIDEVKYIIAYDLTRFFRPLTGSFLSSLLTSLLQSKGVKLITVKEGVIDFSRFQDSLISSLTSQINSEQLKTQVEKSRASLKRMKDAGEYSAGLWNLRGYKSTGRKGEIAIDEEAAKMVREIFKMFLGACTLNQIAQAVNERYAHILKKQYNRNTISATLQNPLYCGYQRSSAGELIKSKQLQGKEIITMDEWLKAMRKFEVRKSFCFREKKHWLPLSSLTYCGRCGDKMLVHSTKNRAGFYQCYRHQRDGKAKCGGNLMVSMSTSKGDGLIEAIKPLLLAEAMRLMKLRTNDEESKKKLQSLELAVNEMKRKSAKLTEMWMSSMMDEAVYEMGMKELKMKIAEAEREKAKVELELSADTSAFDFVKLSMKFRGDGLTEGEYEQLLNTMVKKIVIYADEVEVKTAFGDVSIPRQTIGRYNLCCNYVLQIKKGKAAVYYYRGLAKVLPSSSLAEFKHVARLGDLDVFIER